MTRACKIANEETAWRSIFQMHKKEYRKEHIFFKSPNEPIREAWHAAVHGGHKESDITGQLTTSKEVSHFLLHMFSLRLLDSQNHKDIRNRMALLGLIIAF